MNIKTIFTFIYLNVSLALGVALGFFYVNKKNKNSLNFEKFKKDMEEYQKQLEKDALDQEMRETEELIRLVEELKNNKKIDEDPFENMAANIFTEEPIVLPICFDLDIYIFHLKCVGFLIGLIVTVYYSYKMYCFWNPFFPHKIKSIYYARVLVPIYCFLFGKK
jgi:hypothetical protein